MSITTAQRLYLFIDHKDRRSGQMNVSLWSRVCEVNGWDRSDRQLRLDFFSQALGRPIASSSQIGKLKDFDELKAACLAVIQPNNLEAQLRQAEMEKTRRIHAIKELAPEAYYRAEAQRKFGCDELELLNESQLTMLRNHLTKRAAAIRWPAQAEAVEVAAENCPF